MLISSPVVSKWSGSLAGLVGSHNKGGMYLRQRSTPTNPNTSFQQAVRNAVKVLSGAWSNTLTAAQRSAWDVYAVNVPLINPLGEARSVTGLDQYVRSNVPRLQAAATRVDDAPTTFTLGTFSGVSIAIDEPNDEVDVTFAATDDWVSQDDAHMLVYASRPQSAGINFFKGPYRFAGSIDGNSITPPTSPAAIPLPFPVAAGNKVFCRIRVTRADGRLTSDQFFSAIA